MFVWYYESMIRKVERLLLHIGSMLGRSSVARRVKWTLDREVKKSFLPYKVVTLYKEESLIQQLVGMHPFCLSS